GGRVDGAGADGGRVDGAGADGGRVDAGGLLAQVRAAVGAALADYKAPDRLVVVDALPLTSMMKVDKRVLARTWEERAEAGPATETGAGTAGAGEQVETARSRA
nr:hypothetical protein [Actinomycetota bacterium]